MAKDPGYVEAVLKRQDVEDSKHQGQDAALLAETASNTVSTLGHNMISLSTVSRNVLSSGHVYCDGSPGGSDGLMILIASAWK